MASWIDAPAPVPCTINWRGFRLWRWKLRSAPAVAQAVEFWASAAKHPVTSVLCQARTAFGDVAGHGSMHSFSCSRRAVEAFIVGACCCRKTQVERQ